MLPVLYFGQWTENFDAGTTMPADWAVINGGDTNGWVFGVPGGGTTQSGSNVATITYGSTAHDDYLITKAITVTNAVSNRLSFYVRSRGTSFLENYNVLLSTTNQTQAAFTTTLKSTAKAPATWTKLTFDLSAYNGQTVYVAVHAIDTDQFELYSDTFVVDAMPTTPPSCTTLTTPTNAATGVSVTPTLTWSASTDASGYLINLGTTPGGTDIMNGTDVNNVTTYSIPTASALMYNKTYYVTIIPKNNNGNATGCTETSFTTVNVPCPSVSAPSNNATGLSLKPTISWSSVTGATGYRLSVGTTTGGTDISNNVDLGNVLSYTFASNLNVSTMYYYTVNAYQGANISASCTERKFTTGSVVPPANDDCANAIGLTVNPDLSCGTTTPGNTLGSTNSNVSLGSCSGNPDDDVWYTFVATNASHVISLSSVVSTGTSSTTDMYFQVLSGVCGSQTGILCSDPDTATVNGLTPGQTYYIRVYTYSGAGYNASFNICVGTPPPPPPPPANDNCSSAVNLTVGGTFAQNAITGTTVGSTNTPALTASCLTTPTNVGGNVWYKIVVPASGSVTIETDIATGSALDDTVLSVFADCNSTTSIACNDDGGNGSFSKISLTGQTPGAILYLSVWRYSSAGSGTDGPFQISAYDSSLLATSEVSAAKNDLKAYPNPFADVLNISDISKVKSVSIVDLAGRVVKTIDNPSSALQLGDLKQGMYMVTLNLKDGSKQTIKAIKK